MTPEKIVLQIGPGIFVEYKLDEAPKVLSQLKDLIQKKTDRLELYLAQIGSEIVMVIGMRIYSLCTINRF